MTIFHVIEDRYIFMIGPATISRTGSMVCVMTGVLLNARH